MKAVPIRYLPFLLSLMFVAAGCGYTLGRDSSQENNTESAEDNFGGEAFFEVTEHNFGELSPGDEVGARFGYSNIGDGLLLIDRVTTGCGCTVAEYSENPLKKGENGFVEIIFDSRGKRGAQIQEARVYFRGHHQPVRLSIFAEVGKN